MNSKGSLVTSFPGKEEYWLRLITVTRHRAKENRPSQAVFKCLFCGHEQNADVNAARNILTVGQTGMACQANRRSGRQQEPAENREGVLFMAS